MPYKVLQSQLAVEVDVIQAEKRKSPREGSRFSEMVTDVRLVELGGERRGHRAAQPLVEVAENDPWPVKVFAADDPRRLLLEAALARSSGNAIRAIYRANIGPAALAKWQAQPRVECPTRVLFGRADPF